ncbi:MAG: hypothetical protein RR068_07475 [Hafnia sp.]
MKKMMITLAVMAAALSSLPASAMTANEVPASIAQNCTQLTYEMLVSNGIPKNDPSFQQLYNYATAGCVNGYVDARNSLAKVNQMKADFEVSKQKAAATNPAMSAGVKVVSDMYTTGANWGGAE